MPAFFSWWFVVYHLQKYGNHKSLMRVQNRIPTSDHFLFFPGMFFGAKPAGDRKDRNPNFLLYYTFTNLVPPSSSRQEVLFHWGKISLHNNRVVHPVRVLSLVVEHESWGFHYVTRCPTIKIPRTRDSQWISCFVTFPSLLIQLIVTKKRKALIGRSHFHKIAFYPPKKCCFSSNHQNMTIKNQQKPTAGLGAQRGQVPWPFWCVFVDSETWGPRAEIFVNRFTLSEGPRWVLSPGNFGVHLWKIAHLSVLFWDVIFEVFKSFWPH